MKTQKIISGLLILLTLGVFSSCTKHDRPAELSIDAQLLEFDNSILNRKFNIVNSGDELLNVDIHSDKSWVSIIGSSVSLLHAETSLITVQIQTSAFQEYGVYTAYLFLESNGGNFTVPIKVYYSQADEALLAIDLDYLKFASTDSEDHFTLYNDGAESLNFLLQKSADWIDFSQEIGTILPNGEQKIYVNVDRTGLSSGTYEAEVNITSSGGNAVLDVDMDIAVYSITFFNPVYTPIQIMATGFNTIQIETGERHHFIFADNPLSFSYTAKTTGETDDGLQLGLEILWEEVIDVSEYQSPTFNLNINADYFFMAIINIGNYDLDTWSVNYGNDFRIDDDFVIPNDGVEYGVAYYDAFEDTDIYAHLVGTNDDVVWRQGTEFVFPWIENQYVLLENNYKKSALVRPELKSRSIVSSHVKQFKKSIKKSKGSIDLYNKK